jgi:tRNA dimethylallyltransferase
MPVNKPLKIITIQGTTASGKSSLALLLAHQLNTEIISADSRQIYKYMDIGTAKPSLQEQNRIRHHLIDIIFPDQTYNAGRFARDAEKLITQLNAGGKYPLVVGGTGFYIKALLDGLAAIPDIPLQKKEEIAAEHDQKSDKELHEYLASFDPVSATRINHQDRQKLLRAVSVYQFTGKPISAYWQEKHQKLAIQSYNILINRPRQEIYDRIDRRVELMLEKGLLNEIQFLLDKGYTANDPGLRSVGYQELIPYFTEKADLPECVELVKQHTRNYAKRQITWLKKCQFDLTLERTNINFLQVLELITEFLRST